MYNVPTHLYMIANLEPVDKAACEQWAVHDFKIYLQAPVEKWYLI